jgi:hypothetical protein
MTNTKTTTIAGIIYNIIGEVLLTGKSAEQGFYKTLVMLQRPTGTKEFVAMIDINGTITLN